MLWNFQLWNLCMKNNIFRMASSCSSTGVHYFVKLFTLSVEFFNNSSSSSFIWTFMLTTKFPLYSWNTEIIQVVVLFTKPFLESHISHFLYVKIPKEIHRILFSKEKNCCFQKEFDILHFNLTRIDNLWRTIRTLIRGLTYV